MSRCILVPYDWSSTYTDQCRTWVLGAEGIDIGSDGSRTLRICRQWGWGRLHRLGYDISAIFHCVFKVSRFRVFAPFFNKGMAALKSPPKILPSSSRKDYILHTCIVPWWNREWWEMPKYRYWESYRWKEETEKWSPECLIRYSTVHRISVPGLVYVIILVSFRIVMMSWFHYRENSIRFLQWSVTTTRPLSKKQPCLCWKREQRP
jgi:hypothetical protein